ncbi:unnamed protein product [Clavelina lepadiformis]|uniref:Fibronectin type-III domain-containing protein n=1 Tax=Clavelina lepadiformis TaxID=159417 RepID=A0ABP0FH68_CLALP
MVLLKRKYKASEAELAVIESELAQRYAVTWPSTVDRIRVLETDEDAASGGTLCHIEFFLRGRTLTPSDTNLAIDPRNLYGLQSFSFNISKGGLYDLDKLSPGEYSLASHFRSPPGCESVDRRIWIFYNDEGKSIEHVVPSGLDDLPESLQSLQFRSNGIASGGEAPFFFYKHNTIYGIKQDYLLRTCLKNSTLPIYDRTFIANGDLTPDSLKYTIVTTSAPGKMPNDPGSVIVCPIKASGNSTLVKFDVLPVKRAIKYKFSIQDDVMEISIIVVNEREIDSSDKIQIMTPVPLASNRTHYLVMEVTTRLTNFTNATSPLSVFEFFTGAPNSTSVRIIKVIDTKFSATIASTKYATGYLVTTTSNSTTRNYTIPLLSEYVITKESDDEVYDVIVYAFNCFGTSLPSEVRATKFWTFSGVTNSSFILTWVGNPEDKLYVVSSSPDTSGPRSTNGTSVTLNNLTPGITYQVNVSFVGISTKSTLLFSSNQITVPAPPTALRQTHSNLTSVRVTWDHVTGAKYYEVTINLFSAKASDPVTVVNQSDVEFFDLEVGRYYQFKVRAVNSAGKSGFAALRVETAKDTPKIKDILYHRENSTIRLAWDAAKQAVEYFVTTINLNTSAEVSYDVATTSVVLRPLLHGASYEIYVRGFYETGLSSASNIVKQTIVPGLANNVTWDSSLNGYEVTVEWDPVYGANSYDVNVFVNGSAENRSLIDNNYVVTDICGDAEYEVIIRSRNVAGLGPRKKIQFKAGLLSPESLEVTNVTSTSIEAKWNGAKCASRFELRATSDDVAPIDVSTTVRKVVAEELMPGRNYSLEVKALYTSGWSNFSQSFLQITGASNPPFLQADNVTNSSFVLSWERQATVSMYRMLFVSENESKTENFSSSQRIATLDMLHPVRWYNITLYSVSNVGSQFQLFVNKENAPEVEVLTATDPPVEVLTRDFQVTNVTITWKKDEDAVKYYVEVTSHFDDDQPVKKIYESKENELFVSDLDASARGHTITVQTVNKQGRVSAKSDEVSLHSPPASVEQIPWWLMLIAIAVGAFLLLLLIIVIVVRCRRQKKISQEYDVEERGRRRRDGLALSAVPREPSITSSSSDTQPTEENKAERSKTEEEKMKEEESEEKKKMEEVGDEVEDEGNPAVKDVKRNRNLEDTGRSLAKTNLSSGLVAKKPVMKDRPAILKVVAGDDINVELEVDAVRARNERKSSLDPVEKSETKPSGKEENCGSQPVEGTSNSGVGSSENTGTEIEKKHQGQNDADQIMSDLDMAFRMLDETTDSPTSTF